MVAPFLPVVFLIVVVVEVEGGLSNKATAAYSSVGGGAYVEVAGIFATAPV
jgi:hypothetical protein